MAKKSKSLNGPSHDEIARRAYLLYEESGRQSGHDLENWLRAEAELAAPASQSAMEPKPRSSQRAG